MIYQSYAYQDYTCAYIINNHRCGIFQDMGLGKQRVH